jgi:hypothetical protein
MKKIITISQKDYATDLIWQRIVGLKATRKTAQQQALKLPSELGTLYRFLLRKSSRQYGVSPHLEHKKLSYSAAVEIADRIAENFAALFEVPQGYYFLSVMQGEIHPSSDRLFSMNESEQAKQALRLVLQDERISTIFAPTILSIPDSKEVLLETIFQQKRRVFESFRKKDRLILLTKSSETKQYKKIYGLLFVSFVLAIFSLTSFLFKNKPQESSEHHPVIQVVEPWEQKPAAKPVLEGCIQRVLSYPEIAGAMIKNADCNAEQVIYHYRPYARNSLTLIAEDKKIPKECQVIFSGTRSETDVQLICKNRIVGTIGQISIRPIYEESQKLWRDLGGYGAILTVDTGDKSGLNTEHHAFDSVKEIKLGLKMDFPPDLIIKSISYFPSLVITNINLSYPNLWSVNGVDYAS